MSRPAVNFAPLTHIRDTATTASTQAEGLEPASLDGRLMPATGVTALVMALLIAAALNADTLSRAFRRYSHELWSVRRRANVFDEDNSVSLRAALLLGLIAVVFEGIVLYYLPGLPPAPGSLGALASMGLAGAYMLFLYTAYSVTGYAFAEGSWRRRWLRGFMATQAYTGIGLIVPGLLLLVQPQWRYELIIISLSIYFAGRLLFIARGVRIFFNDFLSLVYFILYLCSLEIIPLLVVYSLNQYLWAYTA